MQCGNRVEGEVFANVLNRNGFYLSSNYFAKKMKENPIITANSINLKYNQIKTRNWTDDEAAPELAHAAKSGVEFSQLYLKLHWSQCEKIRDKRKSHMTKNLCKKKRRDDSLTFQSLFEYVWKQFQSTVLL